MVYSGHSVTDANNGGGLMHDCPNKGVTARNVDPKLSGMGHIRHKSGAITDIDLFTARETTITGTKSIWDRLHLSWVFDLPPFLWREGTEVCPRATRDDAKVKRRRNWGKKTVMTMPSLGGCGVSFRLLPASFLLPSALMFWVCVFFLSAR